MLRARIEVGHEEQQGAVGVDGRTGVVGPDHRVVDSDLKSAEGWPGGTEDIQRGA